VFDQLDLVIDFLASIDVGLESGHDGQPADVRRLPLIDAESSDVDIVHPSNRVPKMPESS
jgi:hypothetical protein